MTNVEDYTVGWICALEIEFNSVCELLDEEYTTKPRVELRDENSYRFGRIHEHNVVLACLPKGRYGLTSAAVVAERIRMSFPGLRFGLLVGIAGGAPSEEHDIRLGDVIVSSPGVRHGGVLQYDYGKTIQDHEFEETGYLAPPPEVLLNAVSNLSAQHERQGDGMEEIVKGLQEKSGKYHRPETDRLCVSSYVHTEDDCDCQTGAGPHLKQRKDRTGSRVHYGLIASANSLMKDALIRDSLVKRHDILCFEMEAAGLMNHWPCLVIRGVCDYSDSHKSKEWQGYAAANATAYAVELLGLIPASHLKQGFIPFSLEGIPMTKKFIDRPDELVNMEAALLSDTNPRRKVFVLCGLGGIGKTQLAVEFMRRHQTRFTAVLWLDGSSKDSLHRSLVDYAGRIPISNIWNISMNQGDTGAIYHAVITWLENKGNKDWLMVFDNVDREVSSDPMSYDIKQYLPNADHGSILITTRRIQLQQLGQGLELEQVDRGTALDILRTWHKSTDDVEDLLEKLDGLPLAIAAAGAYLSETGTSIKTYLRLYDEREEEVAAAIQGAELQGYPHGSAWTTWSISYQAILEADKHVAHLWLLWSFMDRNDLWFQLFKNAGKKPKVLEELRYWLGDIVVKEIAFIKAMSLLRSYSLVEDGRTDKYSMHTVVHRWVYLREGLHRKADIGVLALELIGLTARWEVGRDYGLIQRRILPHAQMCLARVLEGDDGLSDAQLEQEDTLQALYYVGTLYHLQGRLVQAGKIYMRALRGRDKKFGLVLQFIRDDTRSKSSLYIAEKRYAEAEELLLGVLRDDRYTQPDSVHSLGVLTDLSLLYYVEGKFDQAEDTLVKVIQSYQRIAEEKSPRTLLTMHVLGTIYKAQGKMAKAEDIIMLVIAGEKEVFGNQHMLTLESLHDLADIRYEEKKNQEAEELYLEVLQGYKDTFGSGFHLAARVTAKLDDLHQRRQSYEGAAGPSWRFASRNQFFLGDLDMSKLDRPDDTKVMSEKAMASYKMDGNQSEMLDFIRQPFNIVTERRSVSISKEEKKEEITDGQELIAKEGFEGASGNRGFRASLKHLFKTPSSSRLQRSYESQN